MQRDPDYVRGLKHVVAALKPGFPNCRSRPDGGEPVNGKIEAARLSADPYLEGFRKSRWTFHPR